VVNVAVLIKNVIDLTRLRFVGTRFRERDSDMLSVLVLDKPVQILGVLMGATERVPKACWCTCAVECENGTPLTAVLFCKLDPSASSRIAANDMASHCTL
jgi:hypothetical protein